MDVIENFEAWQRRYAAWNGRRAAGSIDKLDHYPFVANTRAPFTSLRRALPMLNLALISSAGAYLDGTPPFNAEDVEGDSTFREIPIEIDLRNLRFSASDYEKTFVEQDPNVQIPLNRLAEFTANRIIGQLNSTFWSFNGFAPNAGRLVEQLVPKLIERLHRYEVQAALLIPASRLGHQSTALMARAIEIAGIPTITIGVKRELLENARPPRGAYYEGQFGSVAGVPSWPQHQRRVLDEALRWLEPMGEPGIRKLSVKLESQVEVARGEK